MDFSDKRASDNDKDILEALWSSSLKRHLNWQGVILIIWGFFVFSNLTLGSIQPVLSYTISSGSFLSLAPASWCSTYVSVSPGRTPGPPALAWPGSRKMAGTGSKGRFLGSTVLPLLHSSSMMTLDTFYISLLSVSPRSNLSSLRSSGFCCCSLLYS